jgi:hypothetical protein
VRHHLSLNRLFERQPRPATDPGFGSYWTVNLDAPPGTKRPRKRGRAQNPKDTPPQPTPEPRTRAGPYPPAHREDPPPRYEAPPIATLRPVDASSFKTSAIRKGTSPIDDEEDDDGMSYMGWGEGGPIVMSDDGYDSEDPPPHPYNYRPPAPVPSANGAPAPSYPHTHHNSHHNSHNYGPSRHGNNTKNGLHGVFSHPSSSLAMGYGQQQQQQQQQQHHHHHHMPPAQDPLVKQMELEIDNLRRQSADQEHLSLRLSNQLTRAETDAARAKQALKMAESRLEDETRRRIEAERAADEEARARRVAEDQLRTLQMQLRAGLPSPR